MVNINQKELILQQAGQLFMRYGIKSVSMEDIARDLGISKKTLYQYVENKQDLIHEIFERKIHEEKQVMADIRAAASDAMEELLQIAKYVLGVLRELSPTTVYDLQKYYRETWKSMEALQQRHIYSIILQNLKWGREQGLYRRPMNPEIVAKLYVAKSSFVADEDLFPPEEYNLEVLYREFISYHLHGIVSDKGRRMLDKYLEEALNPDDPKTT